MDAILSRLIVWTLLALLTAFFPSAAAADVHGPPDGPGNIPLSDGEYRFIQAHPSVRIGLIPGFEPYMHIANDGSFQGIIPDYLRLLEALTGIAFKPAHLNLTELQDIMGVEIDLFPGVESAGRRRFMAFTRPFLSDPWVLVNREGAPLITGVRDLAGRTVSLVDKIYIHERLKADYPDIRILPAPNHPQALASVSMGRADAYLGPLSVAGYLMLHDRLPHLKIAAPAGYPPAEVAFGVRKDWPELAGILDKAISGVSRQEVDALYRKWVPVRYEHLADWTHVWRWIAGIVVGFTLILAVSLWWNRKLSVEISERRSAEKSLRESEAQKLAILDGITTNIAFVNENLEILWLNKNAAESVNKSKAEMVGRRCHEFWADPSKPCENCPTLKAIQTQKTEHITIVTPDGRIWDEKGEPVFDPDGNLIGVVEIAQDITERKRLEAALQAYSVQLEEMVEARTQDLKKAHAELILKERLAVLGNLSGSISHEIRNPLAAIDSAAYLLKIRLGEDDGNVRDQLQIISDNIRKATGIIESLLNLTRVEKPRTQVLDLREIVSKAIKGDRVPDMIRIEASYPEDEVLAEVDARQIRMALKNIIQNAIQAMDGAGTLTVAIRRAEPGCVVIVVSDTGPGIPHEEREKIFQPLFSTKVHGIGFGLSIAKMIIEKHGGGLSAAPAPEGGAAFTIELPAAEKRGKGK